ncbi:hypothetical protein AAC387_Pa07g3663 [Persea americana]
MNRGFDREEEDDDVLQGKFQQKPVADKAPAGSCSRLVQYGKAGFSAAVLRVSSLRGEMGFLSTPIGSAECGGSAHTP